MWNIFNIRFQKFDIKSFGKGKICVSTYVKKQKGKTPGRKAMGT